MIIFIHGPDTYRSRQYLQRLISKFKTDRDPGGYNFVELEAAQPLPSGRLMAELLTIPFLSEKRLVIIKNLLSGKATAERAEVFARLAGAGLPESTVAVFWEATSEFKNKDAKNLTERLFTEKFCESFPELTPRELVAWVAQEIERRGAKTTKGVVETIVAAFGNDLWSISTALDQLVAWADDQAITAADVALFIPEKISDNIFELIEGIVAGNAREVFKRRQEQYRQGQDSGYLYAMLVRQFRILLGIQATMTEAPRLSPADIAKQLNLHPFVVKKSLSLARRYSSADLQKIYQELLRLDEDTKTGQVDQTVALDLLIGRLALSVPPRD